MRALLWFIAVFAAAVALAILARTSDSYVLFIYPPYRVEFSLVLFVVAAAVLLGILYSLLRALHHTLALPGHVRAYRSRLKERGAQAALGSALLSLYEGRYARAEKDAMLAFESGSTPGLAALIAARAAHDLRNFARRDEWLDRAAAGDDGMRVAQLVTRASLSLEQHDYAAARSALAQLGEGGRRQIAVLRMLLRAERGLGNWEQVLRLAALLSKHDAISASTAEQYRIEAHVALLGRASGDRAELERRWRLIPPGDQARPQVAADAALHAGQLGAIGFARQILEQALAAEWNAQLVAIYGDLSTTGERERGQEARTRIERAEKWLSGRSGDAQLLATLGGLCACAELWGKAEACFEASLSIEDSRETRLALARLMERLGRAAEAQGHFRRAAEVTA
jgi:HemY protein